MEALASFADPPEIEAIVVHKPTGVAIGAMLLAGVDKVSGKAEFSAGFMRGHGTRAIWEAVHFALRQSFEVLGLRKLVFHVLADNGPALAVLERAGATREGVFRAELVLASGEYSDLHRYALFRDADWPRLSTELARLAPLVPWQK